MKGCSTPVCVILAPLSPDFFEVARELRSLHASEQLLKGVARYYLNCFDRLEADHPGDCVDAAATESRQYFHRVVQAGHAVGADALAESLLSLLEHAGLPLGKWRNDIAFAFQVVELLEVMFYRHHEACAVSAAIVKLWKDWK